VKSNLSLQLFVRQLEVERPIKWSEIFSSHKPLDVEIGFGNGDFILDQAKREPGRNIIGIEQQWERVEKTLTKLNRAKVTNARVMMVDAWLAFDRLIEPESVENIYCLFPCPWPKKGHVKHRLFSQHFLQLINSRLVPTGKAKIVTDHKPYQEWILEQNEQTGFEVKTQTISPRFNTKYERKWVAQGQKDFFELDFKKIKHIDVPCKKDVALKAHFIDEFSRSDFVWEDFKESGVSIILKEYVCDEKLQRAMIHLVVIEEHLTQHIWAAVVPQEKRWIIVPAQGINFIPTPGVAQAFEKVYQAYNLKK
jgi:tRNA (guanine-N7-)-methyltransferase